MKSTCGLILFHNRLINRKNAASPTSTATGMLISMYLGR